MAQIITAAEFDEKVLKSDVPVLVDFFATWCNPCKMLAPILDDVAAELGEAAHVYKIDVDQSPELAAKFGVMSVPTLIVFRDGEVVRQEAGAKPKGAVLEMLA